MTDDTKRYQGGGDRHDGPARTSPYPVSRLAGPIDLVDVAKQIQEADKLLSTRANSKLRVIADQIRALQEEARGVLDEAQRDQDLHRARCNFERRPGKIYHLYRKADDSLYFSMLSPADWNGEPPDAYVDSYRLEADMSWTPVAELDQPDENADLIQRLLEVSREQR